MGTPDFAVPSLDILIKNGLNVISVITAPDKPAGRGKKLTESAIKNYARKHSIPVLQPHNLKDAEFIRGLQELNADLQIVVAFRMLPEVVWSMPKYGTFNLHASLLPDYRGAAPINRAIMNGEKETGITTFFLKQEIDTGQIIFQEKFNIGQEDTAGILHDKLMIEGAKLVLKTVNAIRSGNIKPKDQSLFVSDQKALKTAPKIFKNDTHINWVESGVSILNLIRGLNPYPGAYTMLNHAKLESLQLKIYSAEFESGSAYAEPGTIITDGKKYLKIAASDGFLRLQNIQLSGKKRMDVQDFLRGFPINSGWNAS